MTFAQELTIAVKRGSKRLKSGSRDDAVAFLKRAGILTKSGEIKARFKPAGAKTTKTRTTKKVGRSK